MKREKREKREKRLEGIEKIEKIEGLESLEELYIYRETKPQPTRQQQSWHNNAAQTRQLQSNATTQLKHTCYKATQRRDTNTTATKQRNDAT